MTNKIIPANDMPVQGMQLRITSANGMLTIEFEKSVTYLQFNAIDAKRFMNGLAAQIRAMEI